MNGGLRIESTGVVSEFDNVIADGTMRVDFDSA